MSTVEINRDLQAFAVELFEHSGGIADWPEIEVPGTAVMPVKVAKVACNCRARSFCSVR